MADIPLEAEHPSAPTLDGIAAGLTALADVPGAAAVGAARPGVLRPLPARPASSGCRTPTSTATSGPRTSSPKTRPRARCDVWRWLTARPTGGERSADRRRPRPPTGRRSGRALEARAGDPATPPWSIAERGRRAAPVVVRRARAAGARARRRSRREAGVRAGHRVALLVPPGARPDRGGLRLLAGRGGHRGRRRRARAARPGRALRGAAPDHLIGIARGLALARAARRAGPRISPVTCRPCSLRSAARLPRPALARLAPHVGRGTARRRRARRRRTPRPRWCSPPAPPGRPRAWSTGTASCRPSSTVRAGLRDQPGRPARGRVRRRSRSTARRWASPRPYPTWTSRAPGTLTAAALADAAAAVDATLVFASPAALRNVVATPPALDPEPPRGAGPGPALSCPRGRRCPCALLHAGPGAACPSAELHTPYGMTEALPVTDISLAEIDGRGGPGERRLRRPAAARGRASGSARSTRRAADGALTDEPGRHRRGLRRRRPRQGPLRPALGHRAAARATPGGTAPATSATSTTRAGCGSRAGWPT